MRVKDTIKSTLMCIKYPFLYPRNRWTGMHYNNWKIINYHRDNYKKAFNCLTVNVCEKSDFDKKLCKTTVTNNFRLNVSYDSSSVIRIKIDKEAPSFIDAFLYGKDVKIPFDGHICDYGFDCNVCGKLYIVTDDGADIKRKIQFKEYVTDYFLAAKIKVLDFINEYPLQWFHCLTTYTEWNALKQYTGWDKAFGDQLLKDITKQLKKDKMLYSWRITDIKEKYGSLRIYCNYASNEMYELLDKYEEISSRTCIICGKPAKYLTGGYILPYCEEHFPDEQIPYMEFYDGKWNFTNPEDATY